MAKKSHRRKQPLNPVLPIATGFLLIGAALVWLGLPNPKSNTSLEAGSLPGEALAVNFPAPELKLENIQGKTESLADYRQQVVLVNNWATWCPPCKAEMPLLEAYFEEHADAGFMIIAVEAGDAREPVAQFAQDHRLQFQVWLDPGTASLKAFGNGNLPNSYVIDRHGMVRFAWTGQINQTVLEKYVTPLLAE